MLKHSSVPEVVRIISLSFLDYGYELIRIVDTSSAANQVSNQSLPDENLILSTELKPDPNDETWWKHFPRGFPPIQLSLSHTDANDK